MGSYPVLSTLNTEAVASFRAKYGVSSDKSDLDLACELYFDFDSTALFYEINEYCSKSYWDTLDRFPLDVRRGEDGGIIYTLAVDDFLTSLLPDECGQTLISSEFTRLLSPEAITQFGLPTSLPSNATRIDKVPYLSCLVLISEAQKGRRELKEELKPLLGMDLSSVAWYSDDNLYDLTLGMVKHLGSTVDYFVITSV